MLLKRTTNTLIFVQRPTNINLIELDNDGGKTDATIIRLTSNTKPLPDVRQGSKPLLGFIVTVSVAYKGTPNKLI